MQKTKLNNPKYNLMHHRYWYLVIQLEVNNLIKATRPVVLQSDTCGNLPVSEIEEKAAVYFAKLGLLEHDETLDQIILILNHAGIDGEEYERYSADYKL